MNYKKYLSKMWLGIGGTSIEAPSQIEAINRKVSPFGENLFQLFIQLLMILAVILCLFYLIWGGIQWIMSGGEKQGYEAAKQKIIYAVIGLVVVFASFLILSVISALFGVELLTPPQMLPNATT